MPSTSHGGRSLMNEHDRFEHDPEDEYEEAEYQVEELDPTLEEPDDDPFEHDPMLAARIELENRVRSGANWFYWIAALSVINSIIIMAQGGVTFIVGLGITQIIDGLALALADQEPVLKPVFTFIAIGLNLCVVSVCALFGLLANKRFAWAFWLGMLIYALDGLIFLLLGAYFPFGFHIYALLSIYGGVKALRELNGLYMEPGIEMA